jgi:hypothetical protein
VASRPNEPSRNTNVGAGLTEVRHYSARANHLGDYVAVWPGMPNHAGSHTGSRRHSNRLEPFQD